MRRCMLLLLCVLAIVASHANATTDYCYWTAWGAASSDWTNGGNWYSAVTNSMMTSPPDSDDAITIEVGAAYNPVLTTGQTVEGWFTRVGSTNKAGEALLTIAGGTLDLTTGVNGPFVLGSHVAGGNGKLVMTSGLLDAGNISVGDVANGIIEITGGTIHSTYQMDLAYQNHGGQGTVHLDGGAIVVENHLNIYTGTIDITEGTLAIGGFGANEVDTLESWIADGKITAYGGLGTFVYEYDTAEYPLKHVITATIPEPATISLLGLGLVMFRKRRN